MNDRISSSIYYIDGHDEEDEWTSSITYNHASTYATAALAEQNAVITSSTLYDHIIPTYAVVDKKMQQPSQQQQHHQQQQQLKQLPTHHAQYLQYNTLIPVTKITNYSNQQEQFQQQQQQLTNKVRIKVIIIIPSTLSCTEIKCHHKLNYKYSSTPYIYMEFINVLIKI